MRTSATLVVTAVLVVPATAADEASRLARAAAPDRVSAAPAAAHGRAPSLRRWPKVRPQHVTMNEPQTRNQLGFTTVLLSHPSRRRIVATLATRPGTAGTSDFVPLHPIVVFAPGETSQVVSVELLPDRKVEGPETVRLVVTSVRHARAGRPGIVTIDDADS